MHYQPLFTCQRIELFKWPKVGVEPTSRRSSDGRSTVELPGLWGATIAQCNCCSLRSQTSLNLPPANKKTRGSQRTAGLAFRAFVSVTHVTQLAVLVTKLSARPRSKAQYAWPPAGYINPAISAHHKRLVASGRVFKLLCVDITSSNK